MQVKEKSESKMNIRRISYFALIFLISCSSPKTSDTTLKDDSVFSTDNVAVTPREIRTSLKSLNLIGKIFEVGSKTDFTDSCAFYFECDCCYGHLVFNTDSTFYNQDICVADLTMTIGKYSISENILKLDYSGKYTSKIYNWDYDADTTVDEYFYKDTVVQAFSRNYLAYLCNNKIMFKDEEPRDEILLQSNNDYSKTFFLWEDDDMLNKLKMK